MNYYLNRKQTNKEKSNQGNELLPKPQTNKQRKIKTIIDVV
jgi:hypothetical protein